MRRQTWTAPAILLATGLAVVPAGAQRTYVGAEACSVCHEEHTEWTAPSAHGKAELKTRSGEEVAGCETCHGPGSEHVESFTPETIRTFRLEAASERSGACLECHGSKHAELNFRRGDHDRNQVPCDSCHSGGASEKFHTMRAVEDNLRRAEPELCLQCHATRRADFAMPYHHPVPEQFMACSSCHSAHGTFTVRQLRTRDNEPVCGSCHEDHQGPFVFEHPAGRASGCVTCHQPHGGTSPKMLTRFRVQFLCLECHANTPQFHDLSQPQFQNCTVCHSRIHGSDLNRHFLE